ncbi:MAG: ABC transporter permease, partial [Candidatus Aminicenantales bacterium]
KIFGIKDELTAIGIKVNKNADMAKFEEKMFKLPDVQVVSLTQVKTTILTLVSTARIMVFSIALIAILIAMMGVINTILMSVMERRQEIGILKSMGAQASDIFKLVWLETVLLCMSGGLVGTALAVGTAKATYLLIRGLLPYSPSGGLVSINARLVLFTLGVITLVGLLSGLYPSWKAGRTRPLDTIRSEDQS